MRGGEPLVGSGELLVAQQRILRTHEIVLRLVSRQRGLGVAQLLLQLLQAAGQIAGGTPRRTGLRVSGLRKIRVGDGVCEQRRLLSLVRPDARLGANSTQQEKLTILNDRLFTEIAKKSFRAERLAPHGRASLPLMARGRSVADVKDSLSRLATSNTRGRRHAPVGLSFIASCASLVFTVQRLRMMM
jgi:hypothetical protein